MEKIDLIKRGQNPSGQTYPYPVNDNRRYVNQGGFNNSGRSGRVRNVLLPFNPAISPKLKKFAALRLTLSISAANANQLSIPAIFRAIKQNLSGQARKLIASPGYQKMYRTTPDGCGVSECVPYSYSILSFKRLSSYNYSSYGPVLAQRIVRKHSWPRVAIIWHNDPSGNSIYCNGEMTKSAKAGDTATTDGCSSGELKYNSYSYSSLQLRRRPAKGNKFGTLTD